MSKKILKFVPFLYKEADLKNICEICGYRDYTWLVDGRYICKDCMSKEQLKEIVATVEEILLDD